MMVDQTVAELRALGSPRHAKRMATFGISIDSAIGVSVPQIRAVAKGTGRDHALASALWATGIHEARILAAMVDEPAKVTRRQMDRWAEAFDSWDIVDGCCGELFDKTPFAIEKAVQWSTDSREYVKRAAFVLMAMLAVHDKRAHDGLFLTFLPLIERESGDGRNFVKKAVNWALRQIGKRNAALNGAAVACAERIRALNTKSGRWIAADALRELRSDAVRARLRL